MGLFSDWTIFQAPEVVLERHLQTNPYHPFHLASSREEQENKGTVHTLFKTLSIAAVKFYFALSMQCLCIGHSSPVGCTST